MDAEVLVKQGQVGAALEALQAAVRKAPTDPKLRIFLFQILAVLGQWDRAVTQLNVIADLDASALLMVTVYREVIAAEAVRNSVFAGHKTPMLLGEPDPWLGWLVESTKLLATGKVDEAVRLHDAAFEAAPQTAGSIDGKPFECLADADGRLGPVLEVIVKGNYYWVPFKNIAEIQIEKPTDLRDLVWIPATFTWSNQGKAVGFIPVRYPGTPERGDPSMIMSRSTDWQEQGGISIGFGHRLLVSADAEYPLLEVRNITLQSPQPEDG